LNPNYFTIDAAADRAAKMLNLLDRLKATNSSLSNANTTASAATQPTSTFQVPVSSSSEIETKFSDIQSSKYKTPNSGVDNNDGGKKDENTKNDGGGYHSDVDGPGKFDFQGSKLFNSE
jgi:hypothetical protein